MFSNSLKGKIVKEKNLASSNISKLRKEIINEFNLILQNRDFYDKKYFKGFEERNQKIRELLQNGKNDISEDGIAVLNRLLLENTYPGIIAKFDSGCFFEFVTFESDTYFIQTKFYGNVVFENLKFKTKADFTNSEFKSTWYNSQPLYTFSYLNFSNMIINFDQLPSPDKWIQDERLQPRSYVLAELEAKYYRENDLRSRNRVYYYQRRYNLEEKTAGMTWYQKLKTWAWWEWILFGWNSGYFTRIGCIIGTYIGAWSFFAFIYYCFSGNLQIKELEEKKTDSSFYLWVFNFSAPWHFRKGANIIKDKQLKDFLNALNLSKVLIFKVGHIEATVSGIVLTIMVYVEWVIGFWLLIIFLITLTNTVPIINTLLNIFF